MNRVKLPISLLTCLSLIISALNAHAQNPLVCDFRPTALQAGNITVNAALLSWVDPNNASEWEIEIRRKNESFSSPNYTVSSNPYLMTSLESGVEYKYRVRSKCIGGSVSNWSINPYLFVTVMNNPSTCLMKLDIPDNSCALGHKNFPIEVKNVAGNSLGTNVILKEVRMIMAHTWLRDLDVLLVSPNNKVVRLTKENGGSNDNYGDPTDLTCVRSTVFTETICTAPSIKEGSAPYIGSYYPEESFSKFYDGSNPNGNWTLRVCDGAGGDIGTIESLELIFLPSNCTAPYDLSYFGENYNSVFVEWKSNGPCIKTIIEVGPKGFTPGNNYAAGAQGTVFAVDCPLTGPFQITGLSELTDYDVYVRKDCGGGNFSVNSCPISFKTECNTHNPVTISESFDSQPLCNTCSCGEGSSVFGVFENNKEGDFDWLVREGPTPSANLLTGPDGDVDDSGRYLYLETSGSSCQNKQAILQSGCIKVSASSQDGCHMSFYYHMRGATINKLSVFITENGGATWQEVWSATGAQGKKWRRAYIDLAQWNTKTVQVRFVGQSGNGDTGDIAIDQIEFYGSTYQGQPGNLYFADNDGDGYGNALSTIKTCDAVPPAGYTTNNADCDDNNELSYPGAPEILCNNTDENCNGMADDVILTNPIVSGQNTCENSSDTLTVITPLTGNAYWFSSPTAKQPIFVGNPFVTPPLNANTIYYVMDSSSTFGCYSQRVPVSVFVYKVPLLVTNDQPKICRGTSFDLATLNITDLKNAGGVLSYHNGFPATNGNKLNNTIVSPLSSATYYVRSVNANGCEGVISVLLKVNPVPDIQIQNPDSLAICSSAQLTLVSIGTGGTFPYTYKWSNGSPDYTTIISGSPSPGTIQYSVTITDANNCTDMDNITVINKPGVAGAGFVASDVTTCLGDNGSIFVNPVGNGPFNYFWSGPVSGSYTNIPGSVTIMNLKKGSYSVTVTQTGNECGYILPVVVINGPGVQLLSSKVTDVSCAGLADGSIELEVSGSNLSFQWNSGETSKNISNKVPGFYSVHISDGICDLDINNIQIKAPTTLAVSGVPTAPACFGINSGKIELYITGGTTPYSFKWSNGDTTQNITDINAGNFVCTVTDAHGCSVVTPIYTLSDPATLAVFSIKDNVDCFQGTDGVISVSVLGGVPPYSYNWNDGVKAKDRNFLAAGTYKLTVTDQKGCSVTSSNIEITQPPKLQAFVSSLEQTSCKNLSNGQISINVTGGTTPYEYLWSNNFQGKDLLNASQGNYSITVTDANNCRTSIIGMKISSADSILIALQKLTNTTCNTIANGSIVMNVSGGNGNYQYQWSNGATTKNLASIPSGTYQLTVSDSGGCAIVSDIYTISEISPVSIILENLEIADCASNQKGNIDISASGQAPFSFKWSNGATTEDLYGVFNGMYGVTVSDNQGCKATYNNINLSGTGDPFFVHLNVLEGISCPGSKDGRLVVHIDGGVAPYQYNWSTGKEYDLEAQTDSVSGLFAGNYAITITDNRGCVVSDTVVLSSPAALTLNVKNIKNLACKGKNTGAILLEVSGGTKPYKFVWTTPDGTIENTTANFTGLKGGLYSVMVIDANGCTQELPAPVMLSEPPVAFQFENVFVTQPGCSGENTGSVSVFTKGGVGMTQYSWNPPSLVGSFATNLTGGTYKITVTDQNNCSIDTTIILEPYKPMNVTASVNSDPVCNSNKNYIFLSVSQGKAPYTYKWNTGSSSGFIDSLFAGTYWVQVSDAKGCIFNDTFAVGVQGMVLDSVISKPNTGPLPNGSAAVYVSGGKPPYKYKWEEKAGSGTTSFVINLSSGYYCLLVEDQNGCKMTVCVEIENKTSTADIPDTGSGADIYPNPANSTIQIRDISILNGKEHIYIFDALSRIVQNKDIEWREGISSEIDISHLPSGIYWLVYKNKAQNRYLKFIKL